jgi:hypothetical protein
MIERIFAEQFAPWNITLPPGAVEEGQRGKILEQGWAIWYLSGRDAEGPYLDYYSAHRMTSDDHVRIREDGRCEALPTIISMRMVSQDPIEDAQLEEEYRLHNARAARLLEEKGFGMTGDEPGGVQMNRHLHLQGGDR